MSRGWKIAILAAIAVAVIALTYYLRSVFLPLLVALLMAYVLNPVLLFLERRKVPRMASIAGVYLIITGAVAAVAFLAVPAALHQASDFVRDTFMGEHPKIQKLTSRLEPTLIKTLGEERAAEIIQAWKDKLAELSKDIPNMSGRLVGDVFGYMTGGLVSILSVFSFLALVPVYLFFLLKNLNPWWESFTHWIPRAYRTQTLSTLGRIHRANMSFFRGQLTICFLEGLIIFIGLKAVGVGYSLLFGLLYAVLSIVPYLGVTVMFATVELYVLADTGQFGSAFWLTAGIFALIQVLESAVLQPMILGKETGLHPILIILALLSASQLLGLFGMLLAIPLASTLKILFEDYVRPLFEDVADLTRIRRKPELEGAAPPAPPNP
jgi:predicted PurR-regulated permease PerM